MSAKTAIKVILLAAVAWFVGRMVWDDYQRERRLTPARIAVKAGAGSAIAVLYRRPLTSSRVTVTTSIDATLHFEPDPLPAGVELVGSTIHFLFDGASGNLLLWIPEEARDTIVFRVHATGAGTSFGPGGTGQQRLESKPAEVRIEVLPASGKKREPPALAGTWSEAGRDQPMTWRFGDPQDLEVTDRYGKTRNVEYRLVPDAGDRWFLAQVNRLVWTAAWGPYWIEVRDDSIVVDPVDQDGSFDAWAVLHRR